LLPRIPLPVSSSVWNCLLVMRRKVFWAQARSRR